MFYLIISVVIRFVMNSVHFTNSPEHEYPAIELDMTNFVEHLSDEYIREKVEVRDDNVRTKIKLVDCKTEDYTDLRFSSISGAGPERDEKVESSI